MHQNAQDQVLLYNGSLQSVGFLPTLPVRCIVKPYRLCQRRGSPSSSAGRSDGKLYGAGPDTNDLDLFVRPGAIEWSSGQKLSGGRISDGVAVQPLARQAHKDNRSIDVTFNSGNGVCTVDDAWFRHALPAEILGLHVEVVPAEEMLWSKAFVMERNRYDGGDIAHLLRARAAVLDWARLLFRFGVHGRVLFSHVVLFWLHLPRATVTDT